MYSVTTRKDCAVFAVDTINSSNISPPSELGQIFPATNGNISLGSYTGSMTDSARPAGKGSFVPEKIADQQADCRKYDSDDDEHDEVDFHRLPCAT
jgi:hypothetical protein